MLSMEAVKVMTQLKELKAFSRTVFKQCVAQVSPRNLIERELKVKDGKLQIRGESIPLQNNFYLVGFGKAVLEMARATEAVIGDHLRTGLLSIPEGTQETNTPQHSRLVVFQGATDNLPDSKAEMTAKRIAELIAPLSASDVLIVLISGGGSAILPYPIPPVTLEEKRSLTERLAKKGANIVELNSVRKQLSLLKGGKLARLAYPSRVVSLIISDVLNDNLDFIACGPTVPNNLPPRVALDILKKYELYDKAPESVLEVLNKEFPKEAADTFKHTTNYIMGNNTIALNAGCELVKVSGDQCYIMSSCLEGLVSDISTALAQLSTLICKMMAKTINKAAFIEGADKIKKVLCLDEQALKNLTVALTNEPLDKIVLMFGGETTVRVTGKGKGGRNQELALRFSIAIDEMSAQDHVNRLFNVLLLSCGTDGIDGPTDAAGAMGYNGLTDSAKEKNIDIMHFVEENDSYNFFSMLNPDEDLVKTGHTGTNVMDVMILTIQSKG
uniref:Glycerate kinase n=1 Tax=Lygus hesperus TaxID=30085 RepID=A0A0K8T164_LYGHE